MSNSQIGKTKHSGWEMGVRHTFVCSVRRAWEVLVSHEGTERWLGDSLRLQPGAYTLTDGTHGEVTTWVPGSHLRMTWQPREWSHPSILQIRIIPAAGGATVSFHQEKLADSIERSQMLRHWEKALLALAPLMANP